MTSKRIDQLTAHPFSAAFPLDPANTFFSVRDATLPSDNTTKVNFKQTFPYTTNVLWHGADGTGATDSTAAFQRAIDWVEANTGYGTVYVARGQYSVTSISLHEGVNLVGAGVYATSIYQPDGVNDDLITQDAATISNHYIHHTHVRDMGLFKNNGLTTTDTYGSAIMFNSNCGEGTKFENLLIQAFPNYGIWIRGAITCWIQDISVSLCGFGTIPQAGSGVGGYGLYLENNSGNSFTGHYAIGISGDANKDALVGVVGCNANLFALKAEMNAGRQLYAVEICGNNDCNHVTINGVTCTGNGPLEVGNQPTAFVHIVNFSGNGATVWLQGPNVHTGANAPIHLIKDDLRSKTVTYGGDPAAATRNYLTVYSSRGGQDAGETIFKLHAYDGASNIRTSVDPSNPDTAGNSFALGYTNGVGLGGSTNITALAKGAATNAPTSLVVTKWVRAQLDGVSGWIPFFV